jgi:hypothetical protein
MPNGVLLNIVPIKTDRETLSFSFGLPLGFDKVWYQPRNPTFKIAEPLLKLKAFLTILLKGVEV